ncbi:MAG: hypothetical protein OXH11_03815 [Candidatus Aminicenantes bacterium]|nr:hypothetical protein [Candidatus Aminicenantes bacterium]
MTHPRVTPLVLLLGFLTATLPPIHGQRFLPDDPIRADADDLPIPMPEPRSLSRIVDLLENSFSNRPAKGEAVLPSQNVNTLGEVPDSSWFHNRLGSRPMSPAELARGPNRQAPDVSRPWRIVSAKTEGITPGFTIRDSREETYFIKFDPLEHPQLATSAEAISTRFFHAFGYHVPENHLVRILPANLQVMSESTLREGRGKKRVMAQADVDRILRLVPRLPDGKIQVLASRLLPGRPLGPFEYFGTRSDDANDIFRHENRRELRALRIFAAWLNHDDSRSINTLDMYLPRGDQGYVKHHLLDFGSCLGSGSIERQSRRAGNEYLVEWPPILKAGLTLGLWDRPWRHVKYPEHPGVGRFEADFFQPQEWKPEYPNPAFERMLPEDAFWAVRILMRLNEESIRAVVRTGKLVDDESEEYLVRTLLERRRKIVRHYLAGINALDEFRVRNRDGALVLEFSDLSLREAPNKSPTYLYEWSEFDNGTRQSKSLGPAGSSAVSSIPLPPARPEFLKVRIRPVSDPAKGGSHPVCVYLRTQLRMAVVGIDRGKSAER